MKKLLSVMLVLAFLVGTVTVTGCGDTKSTGGSKGPPSTEKKEK